MLPLVGVLPAIDARRDAGSDAKGTIVFDNQKGRVVSSDMSLKLDGKLSIEIGGMTTDVDLSQTQTTNVKTTDDNPLTKKSS